MFVLLKSSDLVQRDIEKRLNHIRESGNENSSTIFERRNSRINRRTRSAIRYLRSWRRSLTNCLPFSFQRCHARLPDYASERVFYKSTTKYAAEV